VADLGFSIASATSIISGYLDLGLTSALSDDFIAQFADTMASGNGHNGVATVT
jgi:hypothetical protein